MTDYMPAVCISVATAAFLVTDIAKYISLKRVTTRLRQAHMPQWIEMGSPEPTFFRRYSAYTTSRPVGLAVLPATEHTELSMWLRRRVYENLRDLDLTASAERYRLLVKVQLAIGVFVVCWYLYFHFLANRVVA
jgi:hypothetical protein